jgi:hypothetical protein
VEEAGIRDAHCQLASDCAGAASVQISGEAQELRDIFHSFKSILM